MAFSVWCTVVFCLIWKSTGGDVLDDMLGNFMSRMKDIREVLLPVPDDILQEGLYHAGSNYIPLDSETELCRNHSNFMFASFLNFDLWAIKMVDASSKLPSGIFDGHTIDMGSYGQCLSLIAPGKLFMGQMCVVEVTGLLPAIDSKIERPFGFLGGDFMFSVCVPSSCTAKDIKTHFDFSLNSVNASAIVNDSSCSSNIPVPLETKEWIAILMIVLIFMLVALSTAYENSSIVLEKNTLLCAFSLKTNCRQMLSTRTTPAALTCLNGLRVLAMFWVIVGHRMFAMLTFPALRPKNVLEKINDLVMAPIENTQLSVEIFFLMSGTLVTYGYLRYMMKGHKFNLFYFYFHRYCRLTPALAMMVLLYSTIAFRFADGPMWGKFYEMLNSGCRYDWWATLLYINNYYHNNYNMCISQSWFMSSDFQLYLFSPILLIPLQKKPRLGLMLIAIFAVITTFGGLWNAIVKDLKGGNLSRDSFEKDYIVTHLRAATFLIGMALGYVLFKLKQGELILKLSRARLWAGWLLSLFFILFSVLFITFLMDPEREPNRWVNIPYMIFHRHFFALGFVWIILICTLGHGGWVNQFLSWSVLIPFARLSYGAYLTHMLIQFIDSYSQRAPVHLSHPYLWYHVFADFTLSYLASAALYLTVEGPFANITTWCFEGQKKPIEEEKNQTELPAYRNTT